MERLAAAALVGWLVSLVGAFLLVAIIAAIGGVPVMYEPDRREFGWEAAQLGMM